MKPIRTGTRLHPQQWQDVQGRRLQIPTPSRWTHLQFRRYSGCALCNLHLQSFMRREQDLRDAGIQEIVIFNSTRARILEDIPEPPFPIIADPHKDLYREFGVENSPLAVFNPRVWLPALNGALRFGVQLPRDDETMSGLPADFLLDNEGQIIAAQYGKYAYDQWSIEQLLALATGSEHTSNSNKKEELAA